jgi:hypothetical protein
VFVARRVNSTVRRQYSFINWSLINEPKSKPKIAWDQTSKAVRISVPNIRDVDQKRVMHDYYLSLSIDDVQQIVGALADGAR